MDCISQITKLTLVGMLCLITTTAFGQTPKNVTGKVTATKQQKQLAKEAFPMSVFGYGGPCGSMNKKECIAYYQAQATKNCAIVGKNADFIGKPRYKKAEKVLKGKYTCK